MLRRLAAQSLGAKLWQNSLEACASCSTTDLLRGSQKPCSSAAARAAVCPSRSYAKPAEVEDDEPAIPPHPRVQKLADEIMHLNLLEISDLTEILQKRLNIQSPGFMGMPMAGQMAGAVPAPAAAAAEPAAAEAIPEKTEFDVKLDGFDAAAKIKVIKEVRVITELGLKEAKELVEKAPIVIKAGLKKDEAEALQQKLEAVGGKIVLE